MNTNDTVQDRHDVWEAKKANLVSARARYIATGSGPIKRAPEVPTEQAFAHLAELRREVEDAEAAYVAAIAAS